MKKLTMKWIRNIIAIGLAAVFALTFGIIFAVSYSQYRDYYEKMLEIKSEMDNIPPVDNSTHMTGITLSLADGVRFFDNGKAVPTKADFVVEGQYRIAEREFSEALQSADYSLTVPEDFTENGGTVKASYVYRELVKTDEPQTSLELEEAESEPQYTETTFEAELEINLEDVLLERIEIMENPYLVYYKEGDTFDPRGMTVKGYNNDGSIDEKVDISALHVETGALVAGDDKAVFSFGSGENKVTGEIVITVVPEDEFDNGILEELLIDGDMELEEGEAVNAGQMTVLAMYASGNRILLDESEYHIKSTGTSDGEVHFGGKYTFKVEYDANPDIFTYVRVRVKKVAGASDAVITGDANVSNAAIAGIGAGDSAEFGYNAAEASYVDLYVNVSNGNVQLDDGTYVAEAHDLKSVVNLYVNGKLYFLPELAFEAKGPYETADEAYSDYTRVYLGKYWFKEGQNTVKLSFKSDKSGTENYDGKAPIGRVRSMEALSFDDSLVVSSIGEYVEVCDSTATVQKYTSSLSRKWGDFGCSGSWVYSACTDNTYIYYYGRNGTGSSVRIIKYNPTNDTVVGWSDFFPLSAEANAVTIYKGGYVYTTDAAGKFLRVDVTTIDTSGTATLEETDDIPLDLGQTQGMYYNPQKRMYAVLFGSKIEVYDFAGTKLREIEIPNTVTTPNVNGNATVTNVARITGNGRFIYVMYKENAVISPVIRIYTFEGEFVSQVIMPNSLEIMEKAAGFSATNAQSIVDMNGDVYFSLLTWNPNQTSVYKVSFNYEFAGTAEKDLGSYFKSCTEAGVSMAYSATPVRNSVLDKLNKYQHGLCTDGTYAYVSASNANGANGDGSVRVYKISLEDGETLGSTTIAYYRPSEHSNSNAEYLYYRDGKIYMPCLDGKLRYCVAAEIIESNSAEWHETDIEAKIGDELINSFTYNDALDMGAIVTRDNKFYIIDCETQDVKRTVTLGGKQTGVYSDANYIYALREGGASEANIFVYDWNGNYVGNAKLGSLCSATSNNNVQGMFVLNDNLYFLACAWGSSNGWKDGGILVKVTLDYSVL